MTLAITDTGYDINEVMKRLPHRYPFLLIDRVIEEIPQTKLVAIKNVTMNEQFFTGHFPKRPVMPGVLIVEALAQVGGIAILTLDEMRGKLAFLGKLSQARFYAPVVPGDLLELDSRIDSVNGAIGIGSGVACVRGKKVASCEFVFAIKDETLD